MSFSFGDLPICKDYPEKGSDISCTRFDLSLVQSPIGIVSIAYTIDSNRFISRFNWPPNRRSLLK